ncbi:MAG: hypothetical protein EOL97_14250 [Spirochaetia bacterium]|nr:hypothetical protein [Spirochaetia bacterium]
MKKDYIEMKYRKDRNVLCLYEEMTKDGYLILIVSQGTHPCAYIGLPKGHILENVTYDELSDSECYIDCHCGLTYSDLNVAGFYKDIWFLGWDYSHCDDFSGYYLDKDSILSRENKKWSVKEIYDDCLKALDDIRNVKVNKVETMVSEYRIEK